MDYNRVLVVQDSCDILIFNRAYILFQSTAYDHHLPLAAVFGHTSVLASTIATSLQEQGLVLAFEQNMVLIDIDASETLKQLGFEFEDRLI